MMMTDLRFMDSMILSMLIFTIPVSVMILVAVIDIIMTLRNKKPYRTFRNEPNFTNWDTDPPPVRGPVERHADWKEEGF